MNKDWLDSIRERMDGFESPVPDGLWEEIEASVFPARQKRRAVIAPWIWGIAAAAAVALGIFAGVRLLDKGLPSENDITADSQEGRVPLPTQKPSSSADMAGDPAASAEPVFILPVTGRTLVAMAEQETSDAGEESILIDGEDSGEVKHDAPDEVAPENGGFVTDHDGEDWSSYHSASDEPGRRGIQRPSAGISISSASRQGGDITTVDTRMFYLGAAKADFMETGSVRSSLSRSRHPEDRMSADVNKADSDPVTKDDEHRRPIRAALTLLYPINDVLGIETGVTYSVLRSKFSTSSGVTVANVSQTLGYLGVPLNLRVNIFDGERHSFYVSAGGMVEKCVQAVSKSTLTVSGVVGSTSRRTFSEDPLFWSVNASAGIQLNVLDNLGIYAEPGVSYHFDNHTTVSSIYTSRPTDFILTFGARYSFK